MPGFDPKKDVPNLAGKVILVTGGKLLEAHPPVQPP
jgi:hypothetical protein